jgi:hypothetical protein
MDTELSKEHSLEIYVRLSVGDIRLTMCDVILKKSTLFHSVRAACEGLDKFPRFLLLFERWLPLTPILNSKVFVNTETYLWANVSECNTCSLIQLRFLFTYELGYRRPINVTPDERAIELNSLVA